MTKTPKKKKKKKKREKNEILPIFQCSTILDPLKTSQHFVTVTCWCLKKKMIKIGHLTKCKFQKIVKYCFNLAHTSVL